MVSGFTKFTLNKMADAESLEASVPVEPEAVPTAEPSRESTVASTKIVVTL